MTSFELRHPIVPWQRTRAGRRKSRRTAAYQHAIAMSYLSAGGRRLRGAVRVDVVIYMQDAIRRDGDNVLKTVMDALNGVAYDDDSQVSQGSFTIQNISRHNPRIEVCVQQAPPVVEEEAGS